MKNWARQQSRIKRLETRNKSLEAFYNKYKKVCQDEGERVKELNCLYQVAQNVVTENDTARALTSIARILPQGMQYSSDASARILFNGQTYLSDDFFESTVFQCEKFFLGNQAVGSIEVFYRKHITPDSDTPFLIEEQNLLNGIADLISFYIKKQKDDENRKMIEQQLLHSDRLATIGQLAAGVAHELNEPLGNILGLAQLSLKLPRLPVQARADLLKIEDCVLYSREIIKKLMEFSYQSGPSKVLINFSEVIDSGISFLEARCIKEGICLVKQYEPGISITADPNQIKQVVTNLTLNAIQAMKKGGCLTIGTRSDQQNAFLSVEDTGEGISGKNISKTFMPFFTTKDIGEGTGLGLSVIYGIVKSHNGDIKVSSDLGKGSVFEVSIPLEAGQ